MLFFFSCIKIFGRKNLSEELREDCKMSLAIIRSIKNVFELLFQSKIFSFYIQYTY